MTTLKVIGNRIASLRKKKGFTQEDLAGLCEMDRSYLSEVENGHKNPSILTLEKIAKGLSVDISALVK